jgi:hypothetical protein
MYVKRGTVARSRNYLTGETTMRSVLLLSSLLSDMSLDINITAGRTSQVLISSMTRNTGVLRTLVCSSFNRMTRLSAREYFVILKVRNLHCFTRNV